MARILNVVWGPFPDIRLDKTGRLLAAAGWKVDVLCMHRGEGEWPFGEVIEARLPGSVPVRALRRVWTTLRADPVEFPWRYLAAFREVLAAGRYDVVQWNDLPGCVEAARLAHGAGAHIVFDMHENYADSMWSTERDLGVAAGRYHVNTWLRYERAAVEIADGVLVNIEEMGQRLVGMHGVSPDRISVVRNAEAPANWEGFQRGGPLSEEFDGRLVLLFVGSCSVHRGVDVLVRAMALLRDRLPEASLIVVGDGNGIPGWKRLAAELDVGERVRFEGRVPFARAREFYAAADIGVIPHHKYGQTDNGIPHKYAQNLQAGLPLLVSSCHALERVTRQLGVGEVFAAGDPGSAADAVLRLADPSRRAALAAGAAVAIQGDGMFSWQRMGGDLLAAYAALG